MQELNKILEEMDDEIEKQRAICEDIKDTSGWALYEKTMNRAKDIIRKHMNDGWVPVEERLPEESAYYLVTIEDYGMLYIGIKWFASYDDFDIEESEWRELDDGEKVIAWRPLPEPYCPERINNHDGK